MTEIIDAAPVKKKASKNEKKLENILAVVIALAVVGVLVILYRNGVLGGGSSEKPVEQYLTAIAEKDFDGYVGSMLPKIGDEYRSEMESLGLDGKSYMQRLYKDYFEEFGDDMTVSLEFTDRSRPETKYVDSFLQEYNAQYNEVPKLRSVFQIDVTAHFSGSLSSDDVKLTCFSAKVGGKWYIVGCEYEVKEIDNDVEL